MIVVLCVLWRYGEMKLGGVKAEAFIRRLCFFMRVFL